MTTSKEINDLVSSYVATKNLDTFSASFAELFYDIENSAADQATLQLAYDIEAALAAVTAGVCSEDAFYASMRSLSPSLSFTVVPSIPVEGQSLVIHGFQTSKTEEAAETQVKWVHVDRTPSVGFGPTVVVPSKGQTSTDLPQSQQVLRAS